METLAGAIDLTVRTIELVAETTAQIIVYSVPQLRPMAGAATTQVIGDAVNATAILLTFARDHLPAAVKTTAMVGTIPVLIITGRQVGQTAVSSMNAVRVLSKQALIRATGGSSHEMRRGLLESSWFFGIRQWILEMTVDHALEVMTAATYRVDLDAVHKALFNQFRHCGLRDVYLKHFASEVSHLQNCDKGSARTKLLKICNTLPETTLDVGRIRLIVWNFVDKSALFKPADFRV